MCGALFLVCLLGFMKRNERIADLREQAMTGNVAARRSLGRRERTARLGHPRHAESW